MVPDKIADEDDLATALEALLLLDPFLEPFAAKAGPLPLRLSKPGFDALARIIIGQQVSQVSADAVYDRFRNHLGAPTAQGFLDAGRDVWIKIGLTRAKQASIAGAANAILEGSLNLDQLSRLSAEEAVTQLTRLKGIGPWTAEVYLVFCEGHCDVFPAGDLAVREAMKMVLNLDDRPDIPQARELAQRWKPLRGIVARLFWAYYVKIKTGSALTIRQYG